MFLIFAKRNLRFRHFRNFRNLFYNSGPKRFLQSYQADEAFRLDVTGTFEVKTKDKTFTIGVYPFLRSDHLVDQLLGKSRN